MPIGVAAMPDVALDDRGGDNANILVKNFGGKNFAPQARKMTNFVFISTKIEKFSLYD